MIKKIVWESTTLAAATLVQMGVTYAICWAGYRWGALILIGYTLLIRIFAKWNYEEKTEANK